MGTKIIKIQQFPAGQGEILSSINTKYMASVNSANLHYLVLHASSAH